MLPVTPFSNSAKLMVYSGGASFLASSKYEIVTGQRRTLASASAPPASGTASTLSLPTTVSVSKTFLPVSEPSKTRACSDPAPPFAASTICCRCCVGNRMSAPILAFSCVGLLRSTVVSPFAPRVAEPAIGGSALSPLVASIWNFMVLACPSSKTIERVSKANGPPSARSNCVTWRKFET